MAKEDKRLDRLDALLHALPFDNMPMALGDPIGAGQRALLTNAAHHGFGRRGPRVIDLAVSAKADAAPGGPGQIIRAGAIFAQSNAVA